MRTPDFVLAGLDEAAPALARLRAALGVGPPAVELKVLLGGLLDFVRQNPGALLWEVAEAVQLSVNDTDAELRALARAGQVQAAAGEDGVVRWWPVEAPP